MFIFYAGSSFFAGAFWDVFNQVLFIAAFVVFAAATLVTIWSIFDYSYKNKFVFQENNTKKEEVNSQKEKDSNEEK